MPRRDIGTSTSDGGETRSPSPQRPERRKSILQMTIEAKERETKTMLEDIKKAESRLDLPKFESVAMALKYTKDEIKARNARTTSGDEIRQMQYMIKLTEDLSSHAMRKNILEVARIWDKMKDEREGNIYIDLIMKRINKESVIILEDEIEELNRTYIIGEGEGEARLLEHETVAPERIKTKEEEILGRAIAELNRIHIEEVPELSERAIAELNRIHIEEAKLLKHETVVPVGTGEWLDPIDELQLERMPKERRIWRERQSTDVEDYPSILIPGTGLEEKIEEVKAFNQTRVEELNQIRDEKLKRIREEVFKRRIDRIREEEKERQSERINAQAEDTEILQSADAAMWAAFDENHDN